MVQNKMCIPMIIPEIPLIVINSKSCIFCNLYYDAGPNSEVSPNSQWESLVLIPSKATAKFCPYTWDRLMRLSIIDSYILGTGIARKKKRVWFWVVIEYCRERPGDSQREAGSWYCSGPAGPHDGYAALTLRTTYWDTGGSPSPGWLADTGRELRRNNNHQP